MTDTPQPVLASLTESAIFLVGVVDPGGEDQIRDLLEDVSGLRRSIGFRAPDGVLSCVVGIGSELWDRLFVGPRPAELHPFIPIQGATHHAPATPGDLLFHIRARSADLCFEMATQIGQRLEGVASIVDETAGFKYFDERDLLGFVDGSENPDPAKSMAAALVADNDPDFAGGSYVIVQKYLHDMTAWNALSVEDQERAVGRTKLANIEMPDEVKPSNAHIALTVIEDAAGNELKILRDNMPFGRVGSAEFGTYFIGYAATPQVTEQMLRNMFIGDPPGNHDRLLDFSVATTGSLFFAPSADFLDELPEAPSPTLS